MFKSLLEYQHQLALSKSRIIQGFHIFFLNNYFQEKFNLINYLFIYLLMIFFDRHYEILHSNDVVFKDIRFRLYYYHDKIYLKKTRDLP